MTSKTGPVSDKKEYPSWYQFFFVASTVISFFVALLISNQLEIWLDLPDYGAQSPAFFFVLVSTFTIMGGWVALLAWYGKRFEK